MLNSFQTIVNMLKSEFYSNFTSYCQIKLKLTVLFVWIIITHCCWKYNNKHKTIFQILHSYHQIVSRINYINFKIKPNCWDSNNFPPLMNINNFLKILMTGSLIWWSNNFWFIFQFSYGTDNIYKICKIFYVKKSVWC